MNESPVEDLRSRWGKGRFGKARNHLLKAVEQIEGEITRKNIAEFLNRGVTDPERLINPNSLGHHLAKMCEAEVLERVRRGVYRLHPDRYTKLNVFMWLTGEFDSIHNQRAARKRRREEYRKFLGIEEGELGDDIDLTPEKVDEIIAWNEDQDWEEIRPYVEAARMGLPIRPRHPGSL